jgi:predicted PurR-regulated permease PerM
MLLAISILLEAAIAVLAVLAARQGRPYIYGLAFTFSAYVIYDLARFMQWRVEGRLLSGLFLLATVAALVTVWGLYRNPPDK